MSIAWLIPLISVAAFVLLAFVGKRLPGGGAIVSLVAVAAGFGLAVYGFFDLRAADVAVNEGPGPFAVDFVSAGDLSIQVEDHMSQLDKRANKIKGFDYGDHWAEIEGDGELAVITWGSTATVVNEAIKMLRAKGQKIRLIAPRLLAPAQLEKMAEALDGVDRALVIELSHSEQFYRYLKGYFDLPCPVQSCHRPGPLPFRAEELVSEIEKWSAK